MAETGSYTNSQRLVSDLSSPTPHTQQNSAKLSSHFIFRSLFVAIFIALLPLFPSQAPELFNQTILTRSWELLHLLFVGIAVSYGLFSRRNVEAEKEIPSKIDNAQSYVSRILQVSSVFDDDEIDSPPGSDENKIQTWNSRYFRGDPMMVVAPERSGLGGRSSSVRNSSEKPLLLPVRSLRSRVPDPDVVDSVDGINGFSGSGNGSVSKSSSSNSPNKIRNGIGEIGGLGAANLDEKSTDSVVLPSPIPWRSRSGRMEMKDEPGAVTPPLYSLPPAAAQTEFNQFESPSFRSSTPRASRSNSSTSPSPKKLSPSPSLSPELRSKSNEDSGKKKNINRRAPPPPPPPPPPPMSHKYRPTVENSSPISDGFSSVKRKDVRRNIKDEVKDSSQSCREDMPLDRSNSGIESSRLETRTRHHSDNSLMGKSVRTIRSNEYATDVKKAREMGGNGMEVNTGKRSKDVEALGMEKAEVKMGANQSSPGTEKPVRKVHFLPPKYQKGKKESAEKIVFKSEDSDSDETHMSSDGEEVTSNNLGETEADANEVDKKADEFIAKFREQIRLQRIESIKKSSGQWSSRNPR
ncbi:uncharacterized protein LOC131248217 [Magnolia sinica]|uniref:uncharacterized protein LOC131248217 n=1 Tax=Magnolia sinica TaxID=86752 RepID=UPI0026584FA1|nr:uncharacterized protein LOC131248217 [Magnolia sinica]